MEVIEYLYENHNIDIFIEKNIILTETCEHGQKDVINFLIKKIPRNESCRLHKGFAVLFKNKNLEIIKHVIEYFGHEFLNNNIDNIYISCENGDYEIVEYLLKNYLFVYEDIIENIFLNSCKSNNLNLVKYLFDKYEKIYKFNKDLAFLNSCLKSYLKHNNNDMSKYLLTLYPDTNVNIYNGYVYRLICQFNNIELLHVIYNKFDLPFSEISNGFIIACKNNSIDVMNFLYENHGNNMNIKFSNKDIKNICTNGHCEVIEFLIINNFNLEDIIHLDNEFIFRKSCEVGNFEIVKLLKFNFSNIDHNVLDNWCINHTTNEKIKNWLLQNCPTPHKKIKASI